MTILPAISRTSFASGEVTPSIRAANDLSRFQTGAELVENLVVLVEAILTRRPGTRFITQLRNEAQKSKMLSFRYSGSDYYVLAFNDGYVRLIKDQGFVTAGGGLPYEFAVPFVEGDLDNLRSAGSGNTVIVVAKNRRPQKLTRVADTNWTVAQFRPVNGPIEPQNLDTTKTIQSSGVTGAVNLIGVNSPFTPGQVDGIFRLDEASQSAVPLWSADELITLGSEIIPGVLGTIGDMTNPNLAFDGILATATTKLAALSAYVGQTFHAGGLGTASAISVASVRIAFTPAPASVFTLELYGRIGGAPANATNGTLLGSLTFADTDLPKTFIVPSSDSATLFDYLWVHLASSPAQDVSLAEVIFQRPVTSGTTIERRWQSNVYQALNSGNAGANAPTHTEGDVNSGTASDGSAGITWRYLHSGYGFAQITGVTDVNHATATVLSRLPDSVQGGTYRWWPPSWCDDLGWPEDVSVHDGRLRFARGNTYWLTQPGTIDQFELTPNNDGKSAVARKLISADGSYVQMQWALSSGILVQGSTDNEWITRPPADNAPLTASTVRDIPDNSEGSAPQIASLVEKGGVFIGKSRQRLHYVNFARLAQQLVVQEVSITARHILKPLALRTAWQRDPNRLLWVVMQDGTIAAVTFMPDEKVTGWHRHPMDCVVEDIVTLPTGDNGRSDLYLQTRHTINGATHRYYEILTPFLEPADATNPTAAGFWFVDCGLSFDAGVGVKVTTISGLSHLEGVTVAVFADGAEQTHKTVTGGAITLDAPSQVVVIGKPIQWKFRDLPRNINVQGGTTKGAPQRASHIFIETRNAAGGTVTFNDSLPEPITETGAQDYDAAVPLQTGGTRLSLASETRDEGVLEMVGANALPFTLLAITPQLEIEEDGR